MKWTKLHSKRAVAAKARKRMAPLLDEEPSKLPRPRRARARFTLQIRDHKNGDSLTLNLHHSPWPNRWVCEHGQFSSAHLGRAITLMLQGGAA